MKKFNLVLISLFVLAQPLLLKADVGIPPKINQEGKEFWLCFEKNYRDTKNASDSLLLELFITGNVDANVNIEIDGINYKNNLLVEGGTIKKISIPVEAQVVTYEVVERLAVHISSDKPVSVYGLNRRRQTTDTFLGFPLEMLGTEYRALCYTVSDGLMPQLAVVATEDGTEVTITPVVETKGHKPGAPFTVELKKGDVYQIASKDIPDSRADLSGTLIKSNKKISVFSGHQCAYVPEHMIACNHLVEQMPPVDRWGMTYYAGKLALRSASTLRILAHSDNTAITINNLPVANLMAGQVYEDSTSNDNRIIQASKPVLAAQYSHGFKYGNDYTGDPMMLILRPVESYAKIYRLLTPASGQWNHFVNITLPSGSAGTLRIDGKPVDVSLFKASGDKKYLTAQIEISYGSHYLECDVPFGICSYGFGFDRDAFDAYGNM